MTAIELARLLGDVVVGAFFAHATSKAREAERAVRVAAFERWLRDRGEDDLEQLLAWQEQLRERYVALHWGIEFPDRMVGR